MFYLFAILRGVGASTFIFAPLTIVLGNWFNKKRSIVIGITLSFSGICGAAANAAFSHVVEQWGYQTAYRLDALLIALLTIPGTFILRSSPQMLGMEPYGGTTPVQSGRKNTRAAGYAAQSFKVWTAIFLAIVVIHCASFMISTFTMHLQSFAITLGKAATFGATLASAALIGNVISKALLGAACEGIGPVKSLCVVLLVNAAVMLIYLTGSGNGAVLWVASAFFGLICAIPRGMHLRIGAGGLRKRTVWFGLFHRIAVRNGQQRLRRFSIRLRLRSDPVIPDGICHLPGL